MAEEEKKTEEASVEELTEDTEKTEQGDEAEALKGRIKELEDKVADLNDRILRDAGRMPSSMPMNHCCVISWIHSITFQEQ